MRVSGSVSVTAKYIKVTGGTSVSGSTTLTPTPQTGSPAQSDPLTFLTPPSSAQCDYTGFRISGSNTTTLVPGTYCNGITISGSNNVTFNPGVYIIKGGGLDVSGSSVLNGTGVTFFLTQGNGYSYGPLSVSGSVQMNLAASTSGPYFGILFYQDPAIGTGQPASAVSGSQTSTISGVFYLPTTGLSYSGSTSEGNYLIFVTDTLRLSGSVRLNANFPGGRSPLLPPITISVTPPTTSLQDGQTQSFTANVLNAVNPAVVWTITPTGTGSISNTGVYTAPVPINTPQTVTVTATSVEDGTKSASAVVTLTPQIRVSVAPQSMTLYAGQMRQ
jgi:hypothetical protein